MMQAAPGRRSDAWFHDPDMYGFARRAFAKSMGLDDQDLARPIIGIAQTQSDLNNCNNNFRELAEFVKRGVWQAGGTPLEFPTISLGERFMRPTPMLYRNLMAMAPEEMIRAHPLDGVVLLGNCDKTTPAQLMGAASADVPAIMLTGGTATPAIFDDKQIGVGNLWKFVDQVRAGRMSMADYERLETAASPSVGHCPDMG